MAFIFRDGFDWYATADLLKRWTTSTGSWTVAPTAARQPSGQGLTTSGAGTLIKTFGSSYVSGCIGFAWQNSGALGNASRTLLLVNDGATEQISVRTNSSSVLTVTRNGTVLATGTTVLSNNVWYYIELKFTINASTGVVELRLNGGAEIASTGSLNTRNTANTQWNALTLNCPGSSLTYAFDDLYVLDTSTGTPTSFLGPVRVFPAYMIGAGAHTDWTANGGTNFGNVSETYEDGDGSFNQSSTANQVDTFAMQDLPAGSGSVYNVNVILVARQSSGAARTIAPVLRISGTDYAGTAVALSTSYQFLEQSYDLQPVGGTPAWDISTFNAMEAGYKEVS